MSYVYILIAAFFWGIIGIISKFGFQEGLSALELAFFRGLLGGVFFFIHSGINHKFKPAIKEIKKTDFIYLLLFSVFGVAGLIGLNLMAVEKAGAAVASVLLYAAPVWVALQSFILFKEKITTRKMISISLTLFGVAGIAWSQSGGEVEISSTMQITLGIILGILAGVSYSFFYIFGKKYFSRIEPSVIYSVCFPIASLCLLPFVDFNVKSQLGVLVIVVIGFCCTYLPYYFYAKGLKAINQTTASVIASFEPVVAAICAYLIWGENLGVGGIASATLVLTGVLLSLK